jgi:hypothetical protein
VTTLTFGQIETLWVQNGGSPAWAPLMAGIAMAESSGSTTALNNDPATGDYSVGLWQINYFGSLLAPRTAEYGSPGDLLNDPNAQASAAVKLFGNGAGASNWQGDAAYQAWADAGKPTTPTSTTVQQWLAAAGISTGGTAASLSALDNTSIIPGVTVSPAISLDSSTSSTATGSSPCVLQLPLGICLLNRSQAKGLLGGIMVAGGGLVLGLGAILLIAFGLERTGAGQAATGLVSKAPGPVGKAAMGVRAAGGKARGPGPVKVPSASEGSSGRHAASGRHAPGAPGRVPAKEAIRQHNEAASAEDDELRGHAKANAPMRRAHAQAERNATAARARAGRKIDTSAMRKRAG